MSFKCILNSAFVGLIAGVAAMFLLMVFTIKPSLEKAVQSQLQVQLRAYDFLSNYVCWEDSFMVTLYTTDPKECSKTKEHKFFGITYSGTRAVPYRTIAVDPKVIPLGSVLIDAETGYTFIAEDTGNAVKGRHLDLFIGQSTVKNNELMAKWNVRTRQFFVIETRKKDLHTFPFKV
jgi:3D (Asp-Asp-Asp) domain-containing protein